MMEFFCWIFVYFALQMGLTAFTVSPWVTAMITAVYTVVLAVYFFKKNRLQELRANALLAAIPLFLFAAVNLLFLNRFAVSAVWISAVCGAVVEELLFRGVLVSALIKRNMHIAAWCSAVLFGAYHVIGGGYIQALCALCFGFALAVYVCRFHAVLPCVTAHLLTNAFGDSDVPVWVLLLCCVIYSIYGCCVYFRKKES